MATELVILSEVALTLEAISQVTLQRIPQAGLIEWRGGAFTQVVAPNQTTLLTVHAPKVIRDSTEAIRAIDSPPRSFALWHEVTIPYGEPSAGRELAEAFAEHVDGVVKERL